ncbi:MAG: hypothetical protein LBI65_04600, partial [Candidatus Symbiothrix sp.]|nr:hypothetical protein [Candidatus Symbiothrix sp.]
SLTGQIVYFRLLITIIYYLFHVTKFYLFFYACHITGGYLKSPFKRLVIAGLTRNPLKIKARFSGDPASSAG